MRTNDSAKPAVISAHQDYWVVFDSHIPIEHKENIILKPSGLMLAAKHYFRKYGVVIDVCPEFLKIDVLAEKIFTQLSAAKKVFPDKKKLGLIFISNDDPDDVFGHALPMIWERHHDAEYLFFLDTTQYLGSVTASCLKSKVVAFRASLLSLMPNLALWSVFGSRQIDYSSCYTDALVMLKDGLRIASFKSLVESKIKEKHGDVVLFYMPEILLRTAQVGSYPQKSHADISYSLQYVSGQPEESPKSLAQFREQFDRDLDVNQVSKKFGTFTLFKARQLTIDLEREKLAKSVVSSVVDACLS